MTLIEQIKADQLTARKEHNIIRAPLLTTVIGDAEMVGKNANRTVTDTEVVEVVKKFIKNVNITLDAIQDKDSIHYSTALCEKRILERYLPQQLDAILLETVILSISIRVGKNTGAIMKELKAQYAGQYDGKLASDIVKQVVAQ